MPYVYICVTVFVSNCGTKLCWYPFHAPCPLACSQLCAEIAILKCKVKELETLANNLQYRSIVAVAEEDINTGTSQVERLPKSVENV